MRIAFFEDREAANFSPIALTRPVFELVCGRYSQRERILRQLPASDWGVFVRSALAETYREEHPECRANDVLWLADGPTLLIHGRWAPSPDSFARLEALTHDEVLVVDSVPVAMLIEPLEAALLTAEHFDEDFARIARMRQPVPAGGRLFDWPWDLNEHNRAQLEDDFQSSQRFGTSRLGPQVACLGNPDDISVDPAAEVDPFVVLDARSGPISIEAGAIVRAFTHIEGPCHIGFGAQLFRATLRGANTIGPVCRVGGEVESSILHGYANKYHDGFLGHAYVCPWVNLGALTTNSDLRNDYGPVSVPLRGEPVSSGQSKVGCFIGDHTKTALGTLINTGSSIGVMCVVVPAGKLVPKHVPPFTRVWNGELDNRLNFEAALNVARTAMARRGHELTSAQERLLRLLLEETAGERHLACIRAEQRRSLQSDLAIGSRS